MYVSRRSVKIPVFANGNIQFLKDAELCLKETGVDGIMTAGYNTYCTLLYTARFTIKASLIIGKE